MQGTRQWELLCAFHCLFRIFYLPVLLLLFTSFAVMLNCPYPDSRVFATFFPFSSPPQQEEEQQSDHMALLLPAMAKPRQVIKPLSIIYENLKQTYEVPSDWKSGNITPTFKKGKKEDLRHYRLVSLASVPSKTMKQILLETMLKHTEDREVIGDS